MASVVDVLWKTYFFILIGWAIGRASKKGEKLTLIFTNLLIWVLFPISILYSVSRATMQYIQSSWVVLPPIMIILFANILISDVYSSRVKLARDQKGALVTTASFFNTLYIPLAIFNTLFPLYYNLLSFLAFLLANIFTILRAAFSSYYSASVSNMPEQTPQRLKIILMMTKYPPLIAMIAGFILCGFEVQLAPEYFFSAVNEFSTVIGLMTIGTGVSSLGLKLKWLKHALFVSLLRLCISPMFALVFVLLIPMQEIEIAFVIIETAMPPAAMNVANAKYFKMDSGLAAAIVLLSTVFLLFTLPLMLILFESFITL